MSNTMKNLLASAILAVAVCLALAPGIAWAAASDPEVVLESKGEGVSAAVKLPEGAVADDTRALQVSLRISVTGGAVKDVDFAFAEPLEAGVAERRFYAEDGLLTLYVSGSQNLFANQTLDVGTVTVTAADETGARVSVQVVPHSLKTVNGAHVEAAPEFYASEVPVEAVVGDGGSTPNPPDPGTGDGGNGEDTEAGGGSDADGNGGGSGAGSGTGDNAAGSAAVGGNSGLGGIANLLNTGDTLPAVVAACAVAAIVGAVAFVLAARRRSGSR